MEPTPSIPSNDISGKSTLGPSPTRRKLLAALPAAAGLAVVTGCQSTLPPAKPPQNIGSPSDNAPLFHDLVGKTGEDPDKIRTALTLWLLFTTRQDIFPVALSNGKATTTPWAKSIEIAKAFPNLPGKTDSERATFIDKLISFSDKTFATDNKIQGLDSNGKPVTVTVTYSAALTVARDLFSHRIGLGKLNTDNSITPGEAFYVPTDHTCPHSQAEITSILGGKTSLPDFPTPGS
jgi:hypothetical protein